MKDAPESKLKKNIFRNLSSGAIQIGGVSKLDARPPSQDYICKKNTIANNKIIGTGKDYFDTAAIFIGFSRETEIINNTIVDVPWSGIAMGWGWGLFDQGSFPGLPGAVSGLWGEFPTPIVMAKNKIIKNQISNFLSVVWDGGAIYTTGQQGPSSKEGALIAENVAFGKNHLSGGNTFYTDGGSRYITLHSNASYDNPTGITYFGPAPNPLDPLPYPDYSILNGFPYGSDTGGCVTYGDIKFIKNFWLNANFFSVCPYTDCNGVS